MLIVGQKSSDLYKSVKTFFDHYRGTMCLGIKEISVDRFYDLTLYPEKEQFKDLEICIVVNNANSLHNGFDISYSYVGILDNLSRNIEAFNEAKIFIIGLPEKSSGTNMASSYHEAFWNRFESVKPVNNFRLLLEATIKQNTLYEQVNDPGILFSH